MPYRDSPVMKKAPARRLSETLRLYRSVRMHIDPHVPIRDAGVLSIRDSCQAIWIFCWNTGLGTTGSERAKEG